MILGVKKGEGDIGVVALVRYVDNSFELVPTKVLIQADSAEVGILAQLQVRYPLIFYGFTNILSIYKYWN